MRYSILFIIFAFSPLLVLSQECSIRILVLSSVAANNYANNNMGQSTKELIQNNINETNQAFANNGIASRVELAGVLLISNNLAREGAPEYPNANQGIQYWLEEGTTLINIRNDGWVQNMRNSLEADVVYIIKDHGSDRARVYQIGPNEGEAFIVVDVERLAAGDYTFSHELGHIFGSDHDNNNLTANIWTPTGMPHGPHYAGNAGGRGYNDAANGFHTIMAYSCGAACGGFNPIPYFSSNTTRYDPPGPVGNVPLGDGARNVEQIIENRDFDLAHFRVFDNNEVLNNFQVDADEYIHMSAPNTLTINNLQTAPNSQVRFTGNRIIISNAFFPGGVELPAAFRVNHCDGLNNINLEIEEEDEILQTDQKDKLDFVPDASDDRIFEYEDYQFGFDVYPNPAQDMVYFSFDGIGYVNTEQITVALYDFSGKMMVAQTVPYPSESRNLQLNVSSYPPGFYLASIFSTDKKLLLSKKLSIQRH